jgi:hypothetical protein
MCNSIFGKGQQAVGAGQDGVRRGLTGMLFKTYDKMSEERKKEIAEIAVGNMN